MHRSVLKAPVKAFRGHVSLERMVRDVELYSPVLIVRHFSFTSSRVVEGLGQNHDYCCVKLSRLEIHHKCPNPDRQPVIYSNQSLPVFHWRAA